jgi:hypothetical protein
MGSYRLTSPRLGDPCASTTAPARAGDAFPRSPQVTQWPRRGLYQLVRADRDPVQSTTRLSRAATPMRHSSGMQRVR